jgi:hypothetical protein
MGLSSKETHAPYNDKGLSKIYNMLFCDDIAAYKNAEQPTGYPWEDLLADAPNEQALTAISTDQTLESRPRLLAYRILANMNPPTGHHELLGVIVEVAMESGLDVLAAFNDGTARYINHSGKLLVWDTTTTDSDALMQQLYENSLKVVDQIGPWEGERRPFPTAGMIRLSFLLSDGLYFGEGPFDVLQKDAMAGPVFGAATGLMMYLTQYALENESDTTL